MKKVVLTALLAVTALLVIGCSSTKEVKKEELPPPPPPTPVVKKATDPDITFKIASIDLGKLARRLELKDIDGLAGELKKQRIDILTLQGVSRYPQVATRIDIIDSLSSRTDMRKIFGETIELSGRQTGNAILCSYPVRSNENTHYDGLHSDNFEAALQGVIDCGARDVIIVSTGLPDFSSAAAIHFQRSSGSSLPQGLKVTRGTTSLAWAPFPRKRILRCRLLALLFEVHSNPMMAEKRPGSLAFSAASISASQAVL